ncbi:hypothetical protein E2C01_073532 [Portunus trituberculatus]|uniref:Uncharacterized protein n=1 Tax=Portunus trituberculatus TaxID=210409 RepID=A0A5B7I0X3_PORTR|nr:hypothetical protein [Portunus trituberculatus]
MKENMVVMSSMVFREPGVDRGVCLVKASQLPIIDSRVKEAKQIGTQCAICCLSLDSTKAASWWTVR